MNHWNQGNEVSIRHEGGVSLRYSGARFFGFLLSGDKNFWILNQVQDDGVKLL